MKDPGMENREGGSEIKIFDILMIIKALTDKNIQLMINIFNLRPREAPENCVKMPPRAPYSTSDS
jgi:hypothetical protein